MPEKKTRSGVGEAWLAQRESLWRTLVIHFAFRADMRHHPTADPQKPQQLRAC
jgi:hypothetical protein